MQVITSTYVDNATLHLEYLTIYGARVWVYSLRLKYHVSADELQRSMESASAAITRVIVVNREGT